MRDKIIALAREAGNVTDFIPYLERFYQLAVAEEREAMIEESAKQGWAMRNDDPFEDAVREIAAIRARKP